VLEKAAEVIKELRECQLAMKGYLSAFPTEHFERLRNLQQVWAPFYVVGHPSLIEYEESQNLQ
jgi:hypothetical protein